MDKKNINYVIMEIEIKKIALPLIIILSGLLMILIFEIIERFDK